MQARRVALGLAAAAALAAIAAPSARADEAPAETSAAPPPGAFSGKTEIVPGPALQVIFGDAVEKGQLAMAHPAGEVKETFGAPAAGKLAVALDGSPQKKASYLKIWNGLDHPVLFRAGVLAYEGGALKPITVRVCAAPAGGTNAQTWPAPIAAVAVANFIAASSATACQ
jgi:hypothetical protein